MKLTPEIKSLATSRYLAGDSPTDIVSTVRSKLHMEINAAQLRQFLSRTGVTERRRMIERETCALVSVAEAKTIAKNRAGGAVRIIEEFTKKSLDLADKNIEAALAADKPRDVAALTSAANTSIRLFRALAGLDGPPQANSRAAFNYNFGNLPARRVNVTVNPVPVGVSNPVPGVEPVEGIDPVEPA